MSSFWLDGVRIYDEVFMRSLRLYTRPVKVPLLHLDPKGNRTTYAPDARHVIYRQNMQAATYVMNCRRLNPRRCVLLTPFVGVIAWIGFDEQNITSWDGIDIAGFRRKRNYR